MKHIRKHALFLITLATLLILLGLTLAADAEKNTTPVIRVFYFVATDIKMPTDKELEEYATVVTDTQKYYQSEMIRFGYGSKTFLIDRTDNKEVKITVIRGKRKLHQYTNIVHIFEDIPREKQILFDDNDEIQIIFLAGASQFLGHGGVCFSICNNAGECVYTPLIPTEVKELIVPLTAHELGHAFTLEHRPGMWFLMFGGDTNWPPGIHKPKKMHADSARLLDQNRHFVEIPVITDPDINADGVVNIQDLVLVAARLGEMSGGKEDVNNDGVVNILDLVAVANAF